MLLSLNVKNLALIDELEVDFTKGLNILTGETGAGKSIILGSINLCLGEKVPKEMLRDNVEFSYVELVFQVENDYQREALADLDISIEDDLVVLSRKITGTRSIAKINGETVPVSYLRNASDILINVHGQNESQILHNSKNYLSIIDSYADDRIKGLKDRMAFAYKEYRNAMEDLESLSSDETERTREISFLEFELDEIENANLKVNEDSLLEDEFKHLKNYQKIYDGVSAANELTSGSYDSISDKISHALRELASIHDLDDTVNGYYEMLLDIENLLNDFNRETSSFLKESEFDEERFVTIEKRLDLINSLKSKYGKTIELILEKAEEKKIRLHELKNFDENLRIAKEQFDIAYENMVSISKQLHNIRCSVGKEFEQNLCIALEELNFNNVEFTTLVQETDIYTVNGSDNVEFLISTNIGEKIKPLSKVASGGELSRIMLAIKTLKANKDDIPTMIFDEIDAGISGRTAQKVSEKLATLSNEHQIICITHLPQIAAMSTTHFLIEKIVKDSHTQTTIRKLSDNDEILELARMLGGQEITDAVKNNALEMKDLATKYKEGQ